MKLPDFEIGRRFLCDSRTWQCTDKGLRVVVAILIDQEKDSSWFRGPPYAAAEIVFDEHDMQACYYL